MSAKPSTFSWIATIAIVIGALYVVIPSKAGRRAHPSNSRQDRVSVIKGTFSLQFSKGKLSKSNGVETQKFSIEDQDKTSPHVIDINRNGFNRKFRIEIPERIGRSAQNGDVIQLRADNFAFATGEFEEKNGELELNGSGKFDNDSGYFWSELTLVKIADGLEHNITMTWIPSDSKRRVELEPDKPYMIRIDTRGPTLETLRVSGQPETGLTLILGFRDADLDPKSARETASYKVFPIGADAKNGSTNLVSKESQIFYGGGNTVRIVLDPVPVGYYRVEVTSNLLDLAKNSVQNGADQARAFEVSPTPEDAPRIEFPDYLPPVDQRGVQRRSNPGDRVETRVARLYYFRDAHRVAQIINRIAKAYNHTAVTQAQQLAEDARTRAEKMIEERRNRERVAIQAAVETRRLERAVQDAYLQLQSLVRQQQQQQQQQAQGGDGGTGAGANSGNQAPDLAAEIERQRNLIQSLEGDVSMARSIEIKANEETQRAQAREDQAVEKQFRLQIASAHEDPGTYAPAKKDSVDAVAQVSISVIGEGLLHLRGPIRGINTIRRMIHQIDSPVGQVKVGIHTVQINGERADRMERVAGRVEGHIDLGRFLTSQSLLILRRAIQIEAAQVAQMVDQGGHYQVDRDRKYLYGFFGRDFIDELYEMDSEFLRSENKLLSLHSMDTISLNRALFILALAKNDIRERIVARFMHMAYSELPQAEWDFRRSSELFPHKTKRWNPLSDKRRIEQQTMERVFRNAQQRYHFRNLRAFFQSDGCLFEGALAEEYSSMVQPDTMNSMQRTFLRLAQIFKSTMIAEQELKQRIIERALVEDERAESFAQESQERTRKRQQVLVMRRNVESKQTEASMAVFEAVAELPAWIADYSQGVADYQRDYQEGAVRVQRIVDDFESLFKGLQNRSGDESLDEKFSSRELESLELSEDKLLENVDAIAEIVRKIKATYPGKLDRVLSGRTIDAVNTLERNWREILSECKESCRRDYWMKIIDLGDAIDRVIDEEEELWNALQQGKVWWNQIRELTDRFAQALSPADFQWERVVLAYQALKERLESIARLREFWTHLSNAYSRARDVHLANQQLAYADFLIKETRAPLNNQKLLDYLIDERQEKHIELLEGTRSYIAAVDQYLKRLATALEDDFKIQFYDPAFVRIRSAAQEWDVTFGQVERTTILMNNRAVAIVKPTATMEFDLPKRDIVIVEALDGAKALVEDYGALLTDPTFLSAYQLMGGGTQADKVRKLLPGLQSTTDEQIMALSDSQFQPSGQSLQSLIPDPAIYKFETGTGFEIRPVIQPDGDSIVYDIHYMYTTNIREPVRADEKHLGRVKRHFIDTQVQTSSFELREVSRYQVALKAARTSKGVPLLEDIPGVGTLFRPLPSDESSLQQNIILAQSTVYPTLFDLMGLRWARHVVDLDHVGLRDSEHIIRGRNQSIEDAVFDRTSQFVDEFLDLEKDFPKHYRPDLYHRHRQPSPYHPGGYIHGKGSLDDPTGREFIIPDRRPPEMQHQPPYDPRYRRPLRPEQIDLGPMPSGQPQGVPEEVILEPIEGQHGASRIRYIQPPVNQHRLNNSKPTTLRLTSGRTRQ